MIQLLRDRKFAVGTALAAGILGLGVGQAVLQQRATAQSSTVQAPIFEVDPLWPKPVFGVTPLRRAPEAAFERFVGTIRKKLGAAQVG